MIPKSVDVEVHMEERQDATLILLKLNNHRTDDLSALFFTPTLHALLQLMFMRVRHIEHIDMGPLGHIFTFQRHYVTR